MLDFQLNGQTINTQLLFAVFTAQTNLFNKKGNFYFYFHQLPGPCQIISNKLPLAINTARVNLCVNMDYFFLLFLL